LYPKVNSFRKRIRHASVSIWGSLEGRLKSSQDLAWVVFDPVFLEKRQELIFKSAFVVMFGLGTNVGNRAGLLRDPHGKCAVSLLPGKGVRSG